MMTEAIVEAGAEALMESSAPGWPSWEDAARVVIEAVAPLLLVEWAMTWDTAGYQCPECGQIRNGDAPGERAHKSRLGTANAMGQTLVGAFGLEGE